MLIKSPVVTHTKQEKVSFSCDLFLTSSDVDRADVFIFKYICIRVYEVAISIARIA